MRGEVGQVSLAQDHGARLKKPGHDRRVVVGNHFHTARLSTEAVEADRGGESGHVYVVLHNHWHAVQGAARARGSVLGVELGGGGERVGLSEMKAL